MTPDEIDAILSETLEDRRLSRSEKRALDTVVHSMAQAPHQRAFLQHRVFAVARAAINWHGDRQVLDWLEDVIKVLRPFDPGPHLKQQRSDVYFSNRHDCSRKIVELLDGAQRSVDICVFTITDNEISNAVMKAYNRNVATRIVTDDNKAEDMGSDVERFIKGGVDVRIDRSASHMHHKFAIFDDRLLLTGSYNWTRGAAQCNEENFIVTDDTGLVQPYSEEFENLWARFG